MVAHTGKIERLLGLNAISLGKHQHAGFFFANAYRCVVRRAVAWLRTVCRVADGTARRDREYDAAISISADKLTTNNEFVLPDHRVAGFELVRWIDHAKLQPERFGSKRVTFKHLFRSGISHVINARRGAAVLGGNAQPHLALIVGLAVCNHLRHGLLRTRLFGERAITQVFPKPGLAGLGNQCVEPFGRKPRHRGLAGGAVGHIGTARVILRRWPQQCFRTVTQCVKFLLDIRVELARMGDESLLDLLFAVVRSGRITFAV